MEDGVATLPSSMVLFPSSIFHSLSSSSKTGGTCAVAARLPRKKSAMGATPFASTNSRVMS